MICPTCKAPTDHPYRCPACGASLVAGTQTITKPVTAMSTVPRRFPWPAVTILGLFAIGALMVIRLFESPIPPATHHRALMPHLVGHLIDRNGAVIAGNPLADKEYVIVYCSASWCPPCQRFSPDFIEFFAHHPQLAQHCSVILVSADRDEEAMMRYMKDHQMPWLAAEYDSSAHQWLDQTYSERGIPNLVLIDAHDTKIMSCYDGDTYIGPDVVLTELLRRVGE